MTEITVNVVYDFLLHAVVSTEGFSVKETVSGVRARLCEHNRADWATTIKRINRFLLSKGFPLDDMFEVEMNGELYAHWHFTLVAQA